MAEGLAARLLWVLEHRKDRVRSASHWARLAGVARSNIRQTIQRNGDMRGETLAKLAAAAGVSLSWLASGRGSPDGVDLVDPGADPFPRRQIAVSAARRVGLVTESAIAAAQAFDAEEFRFYGVLQWSELLANIALAETRRDPELFHALARRAREAAAEAAKGATAPSDDTGGHPRARKKSA